MNPHRALSRPPCSWELSDSLNRRVDPWPELLIDQEILSRLLAALNQITPSPALEKKRGVAGGKAANWGEPRLMEIVIHLLEEENRPEKYQNITHLCDENEALFEKALLQYKNEMNCGKKYGTKALTYGKTLSVGGMKRKLYQWIKTPEFRERLAKLCELRN